MEDQYGQEIPADLVVLHFGFEPGDGPIRGDYLEPEAVKIIGEASWYEVEEQEGLLLASHEAIEGLSELNPLDCGLTLAGAKVNRIANPLKRYSLEDGFYHA